MKLEEYRARLVEHYAMVWPGSQRQLRWEQGPIGDLPSGFCVLTVKRPPDMQAFATCCMSLPDDDMALELHMLTRLSDAENMVSHVTELLTIVAHYHRTGARLGLGHTVNFGRPWVPGSTCEYGLLSLPYLDGPGLEWMKSPPVRFLWLIPITEAERDFKKRSGLDALEDRLESAGFDYLNPLRDSVV